MRRPDERGERVLGVRRERSETGRRRMGSGVEVGARGLEAGAFHGEGRPREPSRF